MHYKMVDEMLLEIRKNIEICENKSTIISKHLFIFVSVILFTIVNNTYVDYIQTAHLKTLKIVSPSSRLLFLHYCSIRFNTLPQEQCFYL